ncbi:hypothetical protein N7462_003659 [Penicillium macrosclerotiorum]|uniref:uncharacterized protein n=1 Tax=Penicillium macrosclerotiorum TaxID=303699 RepID=UPI00254996AD|nr:uncharacterized protein N7462_003659 [Penicillium macrosclerotiorum]KAJ5689267.1 hypothetical protein N7462_003659 [Penicillium macrosclerotiorum]
MCESRAKRTPQDGTCVVHDPALAKGPAWMSFFGNFAQIFASLSPRRRADDHQRPAQYRRNSRSQQRAHNARSTRCPSPSPTLKVAPRSSIKKRQNEFSLGSESDLDQPSDSNFLSAGDPKTSQTTKAGVLTRRTQPQLDDAPVFDESGRPNKRRRQEGRNAVDLTEDSLAGPAIWNAEISPPANHVSRASPGSSQYSGKARSSGRHPRWLDEYRNVDDLVKIYRSPHLSQRGRLPSINSQDEQFTVQAAAQRRSLSHNEDRHPPQTNSSSPNQPRCNLLESIELHHGKETSKNLQPQPEALSQSPMLLNGSGNASGSRESSDEIQGEATTQPIPRNLDDRPIQGHRNVAREQPLSPARKRSPTDIRPTDFVRSPRRRSKKVKHQHESSDLTLLFISSIRFGNISKKVEKGEEVAIVLDDKKIQLGQDITGSRKVDIFFRYIRTALRAECHANRKVRLQLSHYEDAPGKIVDIDFLWQSDKIGFLKMVKEAEAAINLQFKEA